MVCRQQACRYAYWHGQHDRIPGKKERHRQSLSDGLYDAAPEHKGVPQIGVQQIPEPRPKLDVKWPIETEKGANRGDLIQRRVWPGYYYCRIARNNMDKRERHQADDKQHREDTKQPTEGYIEHYRRP